MYVRITIVQIKLMWMQLSRTSYRLLVREKKLLGMIAFTALKRLKKEDGEFQGSLGLQCAIPCQKLKN